MRFPIYLDYAASTPVDERVLNAMIPFLSGYGSLGNSSSMTHSYGKKAQKAIELARYRVASLIHAEPDQIIWTSGATEANNLAIKGVVESHKNYNKHIITCTTEHKSVLDPCRLLEQNNVKVTYLRPSKTGLIALSDIQSAICDETIFISIMHVNNEIGIIQDINAIAKLAKSRNIIFHVDASQSVGKLNIDLKATPIDLMSMSAHKVYGPKGIGALFIRDKIKYGIKPLLLGGGQEWGIRSGTLPTHQIVGMGESYYLSQQKMNSDLLYVSLLRDRFLNNLKLTDEIYINGSLKDSYAGILNIGINYIDNQELILSLKKLAISAGSACASSGIESSYVLKALGVKSNIARGSIRISFGRFTTIQEIDYAAKYIKLVVNKLRQSSRLWKMLKENL